MGQLRKYFVGSAWLGLSKQRHLKSGLKDLFYKWKKNYLVLSRAELYLPWHMCLYFRGITSGATFTLQRICIYPLRGERGSFVNCYIKTPKFLVQGPSPTVPNFRRGKNKRKGEFDVISVVMIIGLHLEILFIFIIKSTF